MFIDFNVARSTYNKQHPPRPMRLPLDSFVASFAPDQFRVVPDKSRAMVWIPATLREPSREAQHVSTVTALLADFDEFSSDELTAYLATLDARQIHYLAHSSHSYDPPELAKARVIFFLSRPIPIGNPHRWKLRMWPKLMAHVGAPDSGDASCRDAARAYYLPVKRATNSPVLSVYRPGANLDVDAVLGSLLTEPAAAPTAPTAPMVRGVGCASLELTAAPPLQVDLPELRERLWLWASNRGRRFMPAVQQVLTATPAPAGGGQRHTTILHFTIALAEVARPGEEREELLTVAEPWFAAMDRRYDDARDWRTEADHALAGAIRNKKQFEAELAMSLQEKLAARGLR